MSEESPDEQDDEGERRTPDWGAETDADGDQGGDGRGVEYGLEEFESGDKTEVSSDDVGSEPAAPPETATRTGTERQTEESESLIDPDSTVDDTLTVVVGIAAGIVVGFVATIALLFTTANAVVGLGLGFVAWLGSTAYLVRRRSVLGAVSRGAYGVAIVLLLVPFVVLSPAVEGGGIADRAVGFVFLLLGVGVPAGIAAAVGYAVSRVVPEWGSEG